MSEWVADTLAAMTLDEKIGQMTQANHRALIAESDIAEYARGSSGEPTQGAGAVAMLLKTAAASRMEALLKTPFIFRSRA